MAYVNLLTVLWQKHDTDVLQKRPSTPTLKTHIISYLRNQTKSFDYTLERLQALEVDIRAEIQRLGGNPRLQTLLDLLRVSESTVES